MAQAQLPEHRQRCQAGREEMQTRLRQDLPASTHRRLPRVQALELWLCLWLPSRQRPRSKALAQALQQKEG